MVLQIGGTVPGYLQLASTCGVFDVEFTSGDSVTVDAWYSAEDAGFYANYCMFIVSISPRQILVLETIL